MKPTITLLLPLVACCDVYLQEARTQCETTFGLFSCAKYRLSEYVSAIPVLTSNTTGVVSFVDVGAPERCEAPGSFRQLPDDSETSKFLKFLGRRLRGLFRRQGLLLRLPDGARAVEEEDGTTKVHSRFKKKKKWGILFPLFVIIKLIKIEGLLGLTFAAVLMLKKIVVIGGLLLFKAMKAVKTTCTALQTAPHHHYYVGDSEAGQAEEANPEEEDAGGGVWERVVKHFHKKPS